MKTLLGKLLGFEWVQNVMLKNAARAGAAAILTLAAKSAPVLAIFAAMGLNGDKITDGLIAIGVAILGGIRGWTKPPAPKA